MESIVILFPSDYFDRYQVDEGLKAEYQVAKQYFNVALFDNSKWFDDKKLVLSHLISAKTKAIYRGWMMNSEDYALFHKELLDKNLELLTSPNAYKLFHEFPNIYPRLEEDTAKMLFYPIGTKPDWNLIKMSFERFLIKDTRGAS